MRAIPRHTTDDRSTDLNRAPRSSPRRDKRPPCPGPSRERASRSAWPTRARGINADAARLRMICGCRWGRLRVSDTEWVHRPVLVMTRTIIGTLRMRWGRERCEPSVGDDALLRFRPTGGAVVARWPLSTVTRGRARRRVGAALLRASDEMPFALSVERVERFEKLGRAPLDSPGPGSRRRRCGGDGRGSRRSLRSLSTATRDRDRALPWWTVAMGHLLPRHPIDSLAVYVRPVVVRASPPPGRSGATARSTR